MAQELHIHLTVGRHSVLALLAFLLLAVTPLELGSETVTLQTYYPAPYGIYQQLRTMNITTLAESGGAVAIGTQDPAGNKLRVTGGSTRLDSTLNVTSGEVNIGAGNLNVTGNASVSGTMSVGGKGTFGSYVKVQDPGCGAPVSPPTTCGGYITWVPGIYSTGAWWQGRPLPPMADNLRDFYVLSRAYGANDTSTDMYRFFYLDLASGVKYYCCPT